MPSLRSSALSWWRNAARKPESKLPLIVEFVETGVVDHAAMLEVAVALVGARLQKSKVVSENLQRILNLMDPQLPWGFYGGSWLLSKYGSADDLIRLIEKTVRLWATEEYLSRMVGGLLPRMMGSGLRSKFEAINRRQGNVWSQTVLQFHTSLRDDPKAYQAVSKFILAPNPTLPNKISHSKFLMLVSVLNSPYLDEAIIEKLKKAHNVALH